MSTVAGQPVTSIQNQIKEVEIDNVSVISDYSTSSVDSSSSSNKLWYETMDNRLLASPNTFPVETTENDNIDILNRLAIIERNEMKIYSSHKKLLADLEKSRRSNELLQ